MKKLLSLLLIMAMLSSVSAFAVTEVEYTFKGEDGYVYHFGTFGAEDEDAGLVINAKKYSLKGGTHSCTDENCENAFDHAKNYGNRFGMGIKLENGEDSYTMAPYATVADQDTIGTTTEEVVADIKDFPVVYDQVNFTVKEMGLVTTKDNNVTTVVNDSNKKKTLKATTTYNVYITFNLNDLQGVNEDDTINLVIYAGEGKELISGNTATLNVYGGEVTVDGENTSCTTVGNAISSNIFTGTGSDRGTTKCDKITVDVTDYVKANAGQETVTFVFTTDTNSVIILPHTFSEVSNRPNYAVYEPTLSYGE